MTHALAMEMTPAGKFRLIVFSLEEGSWEAIDIIENYDVETLKIHVPKDSSIVKRIGLNDVFFKTTDEAWNAAIASLTDK